MAKRIWLFKVLRRDLGPRIAAEGFTEVPQEKSERTHVLLYFRDSPQRSSLGFWFQRNVKSMFVDALGSSFTLEFFRSLKDPYDMDNRERAYYLLTPLELEEMRGLQNEVIKRLPPLESVLKPWEVKLFANSVAADRQVITEPFNPLQDVWMRYRDEEDISVWTCFIGRILSSLAERFEAVKRQRA
jgi:hypothetical protein